MRQLQFPADRPYIRTQVGYSNVLATVNLCSSLLGILLNPYLKLVTKIFSLLFIVRTTGIHMDGKTEIGWIVFITSGTVGKTCSGLLDDPPRRHYHGFFKRILCSSTFARLLRRFAFTNGT